MMFTSHVDGWTRLFAYTGVAGITSAHESELVIDALDLIDPERKVFGFGSIAIGVLASAKTLRGLPNRYPLRYPRREDIAGCFIAQSRLVNVLHVSTDDPDPTEDVALAVEWAGRNCEAIQLNAPAWPSASELKRTREPAERRNGRAFPFIFQVGPRIIAPYLDRLTAPRYSVARQALDEMADAMAPLAEHGLVQSFLFDVSGGTGLSMKSELADRLISWFRVHWGTMPVSFGVAGGLDGRAVTDLAWLFKRSPQTNVDAESGLRDEEPGGGRLRPSKLEYYLRAAFEARAQAEDPTRAEIVRRAHAKLQTLDAAGMHAEAVDKLHRGEPT